MAVNALKVLAVARDELGYNEKLTPENLDQKVAPNDGPGNYTKYARDLYRAGFFNGDKQGYDYCAVGLTWAFWKACGMDKNRTTFMLCQYGPLGAGCTQSMAYYKNSKRLFYEPKVGDAAFFSETQQEDPDNADHIGLVEEVNGNRVTCIEFNSSQSVRRVSHTLGDGWLYCFGRPIYDEEEEDKTEPIQVETKDPVKEPEKEPAAEVYTVQDGDTLSEIAERFNTTTEALASINGIEDENVIYTGQTIKLVGQSKAPAQISKTLEVGDRVTLDSEATVWAQDLRYDNWVYNSVLYVRDIDGDRVVISTQREGDVTGPVHRKYLKKV